jgi:2'-5' RNA ligase
VIGNSHEVPEVYAASGIELNKLGCVMLDVELLPITRALGPELAKSLFWHPDPAKWWIKGPVGETKAHITLLYGLVKQLFRSDDAYFRAIETVLTGWEAPKAVMMHRIVAWTPPDGEPYRTIVAEITIDPALLEAHQRLSFLPHVDTFPAYTAHVTLAYVKADVADRVVQVLSEAFDPWIATRELDYGHGL